MVSGVGVSHAALVYEGFALLHAVERPDLRAEASPCTSPVSSPSEVVRSRARCSMERKIVWGVEG